MHEAVDILDDAIPSTDPAEVYAGTHQALASAIKVIGRADDSSGIIGDACRRLLDLHPTAAARVPSGKLIDWMMKFQFDGDVDYFELDPVGYAPALGETGMKAYRKRLSEVEANLGPRPSEDRRWTSAHSHEWFTLDWNAQRLAVLDHDIDAIIRTHAKDRKVAAWLEDTAEAFEEIGEIDLAIDWAKQAADFGQGHQSLKAADYWCRLLDERRPADALEARLVAFRRWPSSTTAARLHRAAGKAWPDYRDEFVATLAASPSDPVLFALLTLKARVRVEPGPFPRPRQRPHVERAGEGMRQGRPARGAANPPASRGERAGGGRRPALPTCGSSAGEDAQARGRIGDRRRNRWADRRSAGDPPPAPATAAGIRPRRASTRRATLEAQGLKEVLRQECHALGHCSWVTDQLLRSTGHEGTAGARALREELAELAERVAGHLAAHGFAQKASDRVNEYRRLDGPQQTVDVVCVLVVAPRRGVDPVVDLVQLGHQQRGRTSHGDLEFSGVICDVDRANDHLGVVHQSRLDAA